MLRVAGGNREAMSPLLRRYASPLLTFIRRMTGDWHRAEELFQEAFLAVGRTAAGTSIHARSGPGSSGSPPTSAAPIFAMPRACRNPSRTGTIRPPPMNRRRSRPPSVPRRLSGDPGRGDLAAEAAGRAGAAVGTGWNTPRSPRRWIAPRPRSVRRCSRLGRMRRIPGAPHEENRGGLP